MARGAGSPEERLTPFRGLTWTAPRRPIWRLIRSMPEWRFGVHASFVELGIETNSGFGNAAGTGSRDDVSLDRPSGNTHKPTRQAPRFGQPILKSLNQVQ
jgi:hypothetical protein